MDVNDQAEAEWVEETTAHERVAQVAETLTDESTAADVADMARVSPPTAREHLRALEESRQVTSEQRGQTTYYRRNEEQRVLQRMQAVREENTREEILESIREMQQAIEALEDRYDADSPAELAQQLDGSDEEGWEDLYQWRTTRQNLALAKAALSYDEAASLLLA